MKRLCGWLCFAVFLGQVAGCGRGPKNDAIPDADRPYPPAYGDSIIQGASADPAILNPIIASDSASHDVTSLIFSGLLRYDKDLNFEGELARTWEVSADGKMITFHLRPDVKWHDGRPVTARDVEFTYRTYINPQVKTAYRSNYDSIVKSEVLDDLTFRVWYKEPYAPALQSLAAMAILPEHLLRGKDINTADDFNNHPIGSGPYRFVSWKRAESIALRANSDYFEGRPFLDRVIYRVIPDAAVQFMELQNSALDMMNPTPNQYNREGSQPQFARKFNKYRYPSNQYTYLGFNLKNPLFRDIRVRRAIAMAIDREALVTSVLEGLGTVATGPYTPNSWAFNDQVKPIPYDLEAARQLLREAGFIYTSDRTLQKDGQPVSFTIMTNQGNLNREQTATIVQSQLQKLGIRVNIRIIAWSSFLSEFINKRKYDAVIMGWALAIDPDLYDIWHSTKTGEFEFNFISYANPAVDRLLETGRRTFDRRGRLGIYRQVHDLIAQDVPCVFLYVPDSIPVVHRRFLGIKAEKAGIGYNFIRWYVPQGFQKYLQE